MRSSAFRATIGVTAWIALGIAAYLIFRSEQHLSQLAAVLRTFDQHAREAGDALAEARISQQAYVAAGQGIGFWMLKETASAEAVDAAITTLRQSAGAGAQTALDEATTAINEFAGVEKRVRDYLKSSQQLMAADIIFSEGSDAAATAARHVETARQAEHVAFDAEAAVLRQQEAMMAGAAAGFAAFMILLMIPSPRRAAETESTATSLSIAPAASIAPPVAPVAKPAPAPVVSAAGLTFKAAAALATDFGRVRDLDELNRIIGRAADVMDATGLMVWIGSSTGADLRPVLAHGYSANMIARMPSVPRSADNAAAAAYRSGLLQIVLSRPGGAAGAVVAPIMGPEGCIGALSAEIRSGGEASESVQALATIFAAHLAGVLATAPAEIAETKAAAVQG